MACTYLGACITNSSCLGSGRQGLTFIAAQISGRKASRMVLYMPSRPCPLASLHNMLRVEDTTMMHDCFSGTWVKRPPRCEHA